MKTVKYTYFTKKKESVIMNIGPKEAPYFLAKVDRNRALNKNNLKALMYELEHNKWVNNREPIKIRIDGCTGDGQHRLEAIVKTGITVPITVSFGYTKEELATIDSGKSRTIADNIYLSTGNKNGNQLSGRIRVIEEILNGKKAKLSTGMFNDLMKTWGPGIDWSLEMFPKSHGMNNSYISGAFAFVYTSHPKERKLLEEMAFKLVSGEGLNSGDPELLLRNAVLVNGSNPLNRGRSLAIKTLQAIMAKINGDKMTCFGNKGEFAVDFFMGKKLNKNDQRH